MISPSPPDFSLAGFAVVSRRTCGPVGLLLRYRRSLLPAIRVFLISFFVIPYFIIRKGKLMAHREKNALPGFRLEARS